MTVIRTQDGNGIDASNPLPHKRQSIYAKTTQTINAVSVGASSNINGAWVDCDGFDEIAITFANDSPTSSTLTLHWSNDGINLHGVETLVESSTLQQKAGVSRIKARYARIQITNGDAVAHIMSAWVYLKA